MRLGKKTNNKIKFIKQYLSDNGLANLTSAKEVYDFIKKDRPELMILRPTVQWFQKVFDAYYHYLQAPAEQKEVIIKTFVAFREEKLENLRRKREHRKVREKEFEISETEIGDFYSHQNAQILYNSSEWQKLRYFVLSRDKGVCQLCGRGRKDGVVLHIDHIVPLSVDWSKRLDPNNLQTLCEDCNLGKSNKDCIDWR